MKKLHSFVVNKKQTVEVEKISINDKNETVKTLVKEEQEIPHKYFLRRPNRPLFADASLFFAAKVAEGVRAGLLTIPLLEKRNINDGGVENDHDKAKYAKLLEENIRLENDLQKFAILANPTADEIKEKEKISAQIVDNRLKLHRLQSMYDAVYENTAETRAFNLTTNWWLLMLAYEEKDGKESPFFGEGSYDQKIAKYDELTESEDPFINQVIFKFLTYVSLWVNNQSLTPEDFERFEKLMAEDIKASQTKPPETNGQASPESA